LLAKGGQARDLRVIQPGKHRIGGFGHGSKTRLVDAANLQGLVDNRQ
jgi:hypothetical protein